MKNIEVGRKIWTYNMNDKPIVQLYEVLGIAEDGAVMLEDAIGYFYIPCEKAFLTELDAWAGYQHSCLVRRDYLDAQASYALQRCLELSDIPITTDGSAP